MKIKTKQLYVTFMLVIVLLGVICLLFSSNIVSTWQQRNSLPKKTSVSLFDENHRFVVGNDNDDLHKDHGDFFRPVKTRTIYPITTWTPYKINNPNICRGSEKVSVIVMVHTAPSHFKTRAYMRHTWLNASYYSPENVRVIYLLGLVTNHTTQLQIEQESSHYGDIIQGYFMDTYKNLTNKGVMGYRWITENCMNAEFVLKVDDDFVVNLFKFFENFKSTLLSKRGKLIYCNKINANDMRIIRDNTSKWFVSNDEYRSFTSYPHTYCSGLAVFISTDLIPSLFQAAKATPFFWVDDLFLFGILPSRIKNVIFESFKTYKTLSYSKALECYHEKKRDCRYLVMQAPKKNIQIMWNAISADRKQSIYGYYYYTSPKKN